MSWNTDCVLLNVIKDYKLEHILCFITQE